MRLAFNRILYFIFGFKKYNLSFFRNDILSAFTIISVAIPQSIAYAIIAGIPITYGLIAICIPSIFATMSGSSKHLHTGPTNATSLLIFSVIFALDSIEEKAQLIFLIAIISGFIRIFIGLLNLGNILNFISNTVLFGFITGAGILIIGNQIKNILGLDIETSEHFYKTMHETFLNADKVNIFTFFIAIISMFVAYFLKKINKKIPAILISIIFTSFLVYIFQLSDKEHGVKTVILENFSLFKFYFGSFNYNDIKKLLPISIAVALLGSIEALSIAKSIATKTNEKVNYNRELISQGITNIFAGFIASMPVSGSFSRSSISLLSGAKTKLSNIFAGIFAGIFIIFFYKIINFVPLASIAGILIVTSINMININQIKIVLKCSRSDIVIFFATVLTAILFGLKYSIFIGIFLSIFFLMRIISIPRAFEVIPSKKTHKLWRVDKMHITTPCPQIMIFEIVGNFFFGSLDEIETKLLNLSKRNVRVIIIHMKGIEFIDSASVLFLRRIINHYNKIGVLIILSGVNANVKKILKKVNIRKTSKKNYYYRNVEDAIYIANKLVDKKKCEECKIKAFWECEGF